VKAIKNIQLTLGRLTLKKKKKRLNRKVKSFSIKNATTIGVLYDATNRSTSDTVKKFIQYLKEERKDVLSLGYINSKDSSEIVKPHLNYIYFDNNNLSKTLIPNGTEIQNFIQKPYSILIDLNIDDSFPLEYISSLSHAKFKVGAAGHYRNDSCDLILNIEENKSVEFLIIQMKHYLRMIKT
jgi:Family of unknown function (DUF6913)